MNITIQPNCSRGGSQEGQDSETEEDSFGGKTALYLMKDGKFCCKKCNHLFTQKTNLQRHLRKIHKLETTSNARTTCIHPGCRQEFYHKTKLIQHLEEEHGMATQKSELSFENEEKFFQWKEREESQNFAYFSKERGAIKSSLCIHQTYACQRNGSSRSHKAKGSPPRKTSRRMSKGCVKTDMICPARIITVRCLKSGSVKVTYYRSHSHPLLSTDIKFHPLPQKLRDDLKLKIAFGVTVEDIQKDLARPNHSNIENLTVFKKQMGISRHHMQQMKRNIFKRAEKSPETLDSISNLAILLEKHRSDGHNPVILYKPEGGQYMMGKLDSDAVTVESSPMVVALQTKQQLHMLQLFTVKYLCVDSVQFQDYLLVNVGMRDDYGRGHTVAHLICSPDDQAALFYFFQMISESFNRSMMVGLLTDDSSSCINILLAIFGENLGHALCKHYVRRDWLHHLQDTVPDKELRREIYASLVMLMEESNVNQFTNMASRFIDRYRLKAKFFVKHFKESYLNRCHLWASCYGSYSADPTNTSIYDEAFHKPLHSFLSEQSGDREVYDLIAFLVKVADDTGDRSILQSCLQPMQAISTWSTHEQSLQIPDDRVSRMMPKLFSVKTDTDLLHIKRVKMFCPETLCANHCLNALCVELCPHLYTCSCGEDSRLCVHIHKIHIQMQTAFLAKVKSQLMEIAQRSAPVPAAHPSPLSVQQKLRRSPRRAREGAAVHVKEDAMEGDLRSFSSSNATLKGNHPQDQSDGEEDDDDDDDDDHDGELFIADTEEHPGNTENDHPNSDVDPGLLFNADPVPMEDEDCSEMNLKKILDVNDELLVLLENEKVQANLLPYVLDELTNIVKKCKAHAPVDALLSQNVRRRPKRKITTPLPLLQIKIRGAALQKAATPKPLSLQRTSVEHVGVMDAQELDHQGHKPIPATTNTSAVINDLLSYVITSTAPAQPSNPVHMLSVTSSGPVPLTCEGIPSTAQAQMREPSPVPHSMSVPSSNNIQILHSGPISSTSVVSEPSQMEAESLQPLAAPLQQSQRHLFSHLPAPSLPDLASLSSQLVSSLPSALSASSAGPHLTHQEPEYIHRQPNLTPTGTVVSQLLPRAAASPYLYTQPLPTMEPSPLITTTQASQSLNLTGHPPNLQGGMAASYLASQLGHRVLPAQPLGQHLSSPYALTGAGQPLTPVHQSSHSLPQPRQYLAAPNQTLQTLQPSPFMSTLPPLQHLASTPPPLPQQGHQPDPSQRVPQHQIYGVNVA